jgi:hypothetical protein
MKKIFTILVAVLLTASLLAQSPEKMSYQAIIRNGSDVLVTNTQIGMQITILQDSISGAAVYVETQTPTTNANGLVNLEIGGGTVLNGDFSTIDWSSGPYFIKTETDPAGGTFYTITGTSQLMSVPYALYAKTAESLVTTTHYSVGDFAFGGIVFWVDASGEHGLVCAKTDQSSAIPQHGYRDPSQPSHELITGDGIYGGKMATVFLSMYWDSGIHPARICQELVITEDSISYGDWYLPSKEELNLMYINKNIINNTALANGGTSFASTAYWSSSNYNSNLWLQWFTNGNQYAFGNGLEYPDSYVRAIRAF